MPPEKFRATSNSIPRKMGLPLSARAGCTAKNLLRFHIPPEFHLPHPLTIVDQKDLDEVYSLIQGDP
jgi:hypothetical protein